MKRVFHLYKTFSPHTRGGVETYIESIINSQSKFDHQILSIGNNKLSNSKKIIFQETFNYSSDVFSISLCKYILKKIDRENDIIHLHTPWPTMEFFLCFFNFKKIVVTYHSDIIRQKFINFFFKYITIFFLKIKTNKVVVTSERYYKSSKILKRIPQKKICIIPIGIEDLNINVNLKIDLKENYILFIGSNRSYKGIPLLEELVKKSSENFILIGSGLSKFNKYSNVKLYENISEEIKAKLISDASVLLMTSTSRNEAYGIVLIEALRSGIPVISPNIESGVSWVNQNNLTGFIYETGNLEDLINKLRKIKDMKKNEYLEMRYQARKRYEHFFELNLMIESLDKIYSETSK